MPPKKQTVEQKERARKAVELKIAGATWPEIAEELGMETEAGPRLLVARYFETTAKAQFEAMHPIVLERAELLWRRAWNKLTQLQRDSADLDDWDKAMRQCVTVLNSIARISGLGNGPTINVNVSTPDDIRRLRDEFYQLRGLPDPRIVDGEVDDSLDSNGESGNGSGLELEMNNNSLGGLDD